MLKININETIKDIFNNIVKYYMKDTHDEYFDVDFEIFLDEFCKCYGSEDEVGSYLSKIISDEYKKRIKVFELLPSDARRFAIDAYKDRFLSDSVSFTKGTEFDCTASDFIDTLGLTQISVYDDETEEYVCFIFDFSNATFDPYHFLSLESVYINGNVIDSVLTSLVKEKPSKNLISFN